MVLCVSGYYRRPSVATLACGVAQESGIHGSSVEDHHLLLSTRTCKVGVGGRPGTEAIKLELVYNIMVYVDCAHHKLAHCHNYVGHLPIKPTFCGYIP